MLSPQQWCAAKHALHLEILEVRLLKHLFDDRTEREIAAKLAIPQRNVQASIARLNMKLGVRSRAELVLHIIIAGAAAGIHKPGDTSAPEEAPPLQTVLSAKMLMQFLAADHRFDIVSELLSGPKNVTALMKAVGVTMPRMSQNLSALRSWNIARCRRVGRECIYEINPDHFYAEWRPDGLVVTLRTPRPVSVTLRTGSTETGEAFAPAIAPPTKPARQRKQPAT